MVALLADRNTPIRLAQGRNFPVAAGAKIWAGALVVLSGGNAAPGSAALNLIAVGRAEEMVDNAGGAAGAKRIEVSPGIFRWANSNAADAIALADIGSTCFVVDDQTVAKTNGGGTRSAAGTVFDVDAQGVWVRIS